MRNQKCIRKTISEDTGIKSFLDMIAPSVVKFNPDHFICGNTFRCVWALREYPTQTDEQALLRHLGEKDGITLRIYTRQLTPAEEDRIIQNATNKNRMGSSNTNDLRQTVTAESNLQDVASLIASMHRNREPLFHCAVYLELTAPDYDALKLLQTDVLTELVRSKLNVDMPKGHIPVSLTRMCSMLFSSLSKSARRLSPEQLPKISIRLQAAFSVLSAALSIGEGVCRVL